MPGSTGDSNRESIELGVSRRTLMSQITAAGMAGGLAGLAGCSGLQQEQEETPMETDPSNGEGSDDGGGSNGEGQVPDFQRVPLTPPPTADQIDYSNPTQSQREVAFVTHNGTNEVFIPAIAMMNDAMNNYGWTGEFTGPTGNDQAAQVEILNTKVQTLSEGDVLATTVLDGNSYAEPVRNAVEKGVAVVQWNTTVQDWDYDFMVEEFGYPIPYVGQTHFPAGNAVGKTAYEKAEANVDADEYTVLNCTGVPGHPALQARNAGIRNYLELQDNVEVLDLLDVSTDTSQAITRVQDAYSSNPDINMVLGSGFWGPTAGARLMKNEGLSKSDMLVGGFDFTENVLNGIANDRISFSVGQDYPAQGAVPIFLAYRWLDRGAPMKDFITGITVVDSSNIDFALKRADGWTKLRSYYENN